MFAFLAISVILGLSVYLTGTILFNDWIDNKYNSPEKKAERYDRYIGNLQEYVTQNGVSSADTDDITKWMNDNRNVYLFLYKDGGIFFDGSAEKSPSGNGEGGSYDSAAPSGEVENGLRPVKFSDSTIYVSLFDFTDYIYRDVSNAVCLIAGFVTLALTLMIYFHVITAKISRLAQDVSAVYEVDHSHEIRTEDGNHELAILTKNIEYMRASMVSSLEKEKRALDANAQLITSMSHDIRTPLTVLLGYLDVMKTVNTDSKLNEYISASETTALKLKELSDDMFRYFLVFSGNDISAEITSYDAKTLLEQLLSEHVLLLNEKGYEVNIQRGAGVVDDLKIMTDAPKLVRVIDNLFSNIYKYADKENRITIAMMVARRRLNLIIKNQVDQNASRAESSGVGLKTCAKVCESLGARFNTEITGSKGSKVFTAHIELPIAKENDGNEA